MEKDYPEQTFRKTHLNSLYSILSKDPAAHGANAFKYWQNWGGKVAGDDTDSLIDERRKNYKDLVNQYYNLVTDLFEYGWGRSFHFCTFKQKASFRQAIAAHEVALGNCLDLSDASQVLDVGCGVGGPAQEIAMTFGCKVTGLNISQYQIQRARAHVKARGLDQTISFVEGDFMKMPFPDNSFDAVYAIEATVHAQALSGVYKEIFRVLKPGGLFGVYEWVMTETYDNKNEQHRLIRQRIEQGNGIPCIHSIVEANDAMAEAGFEVQLSRDLANDPCQYPWYWPLSGRIRHVHGFGDLLRVIRITTLGRLFTQAVLTLLEWIGIAPPGTSSATQVLEVAAAALVQGGEKQIFSPIYCMVGRKPKL